MLRRILLPPPLLLLPLLMLIASAAGVTSVRPSAAQSGDVLVRFTADNAYGFGYGDVNTMANYFGGLESRLANEIFSCNPAVGVEEYTVPAASVDDYLYVIAWSDKAVTQGVIGHFTAGGQTLYTGIGSWQVYATGADYSPPSPGPGPGLAEINVHIAEANASAGDRAATSGGWVDVNGQGGSGALVFGEANDDSAGRGNFPAMPCLDARARWMWYNSDPAAWPDPFRAGPRPGGHKEYLIFRLPVREILQTPTPSPEASPTIAPSATPSPTSTSTSTFTSTPTQTQTLSPTSTPLPLPIYLPLLLRERCPPADLFSDIALVLDASTTMRERTGSGRLKIEAAQAAARTFLAGLRLQPGGDRVSLIRFNADAEILLPLTDDRAALEAALDRIVIQQQSRIDLGLAAGAESLRAGWPEAVRALILLSDGKANPVPASAVIEAAEAARGAGITLYAVGLGPSLDAAVLRGVAGDPSRYYPAEDPDLLSAIYADLARRVPCPPSAYWGRR